MVNIALKLKLIKKYRIYKVIRVGTLDNTRCINRLVLVRLVKYNPCTYFLTAFFTRFYKLESFFYILCSLAIFFLISFHQKIFVTN